MAVRPIKTMIMEKTMSLIVLGSQTFEALLFERVSFGIVSGSTGYVVV
jgi:hypothetical protein